MNNLLEHANSMLPGTLMEAVGIRFTRVKKGEIEATMPVDPRTHQPYGLLHGGASAALAETVASFGSHLLEEENGKITVGVDLTIHHLKSKKQGEVTAKAKIIHQGKSLHVWNIDIVDEEQQLIAVSRVTVMVRNPLK